MRKAFFGLALSLMAAVPAHASHGDTLVVQGTILAGNPATKYYGGVTELVSPCGGSVDPEVPAGAAQGVDGYWITLSGYDGHRATLVTGGPDGPNVPGPDADVWFYTEGCTLIGPSADENAYHMATSSGREFGVIPAETAFAVVDLAVGVAATFTFTVQG